jgi:hypothetical protein
MFKLSNLPAIRRANLRKFYGVEVSSPREASNRLQVISADGIVEIFLNFENKATFSKYKAFLLSLPEISGEKLQLAKMNICEKSQICEENSHRETFVRYYFFGQYITIKVESLSKGKQYAAMIKDKLNKEKITLIKETLNGEAFRFPEDSLSTIFVFCRLKVRKFATTRYSLVVARSAEGRQQAIFRRRN